MAQKLKGQEENALEIKKNFSSLQQEVDIKTKKPKKVKTVKFMSVFHIVLKCFSSFTFLRDLLHKNDSPETFY